MKKILTLLVGMSFLWTSCNTLTPAAPTITSSPSATPPPPTVTASVTPTFPPTETFTPSPTPTDPWIAQGPGDVTVPILLYHRIDISSTDTRYYVSPDKFEEEMKLLHDWGYTSITTTMLIRAINEGTKLPPRPFMLTIDDGNIDNYTTAFPILQKYGYTGVLYVVGNYIGAQDYMTVEQILEMHNAGWEVGSHSMTHRDLTKMNADQIRYEIVSSREILEKKLGIPILTFAYPFGASSDTAKDYVEFAGYIGAMGAKGYLPSQGTWNLYYLQRMEIKGTEDAKTFTRFLPWQGDPSFLPTDTPTP